MRRDNRMPFGRRKILGVVAAAAAAAAVSLLGTEVGASVQKGRLKIAVCKEGYAPFVFQGADGKWQGYEMEVLSGLFDHIRTEAYFTRNETVIDWIGDVPPEVFPMGFPTKEEAGAALASMPGGAPPELTKLLANSRGALDNLIVAAWANHTDILMCGYQVQDYRTRAADFAIYLSVHTGYVVTVPSKAEGETIPVTDVLGLTITSPQPTAVLSLLLLAIFSIVYAHIMWVLERSENIGIRSEYGPGIFDAWWLAMVTATTVGYGDVAPVTFSGRILTVAWMLTGMYCVGLFGASVTTGLVAESISSSSASVEDTSKILSNSLSGKVVGGLVDVTEACNKALSRGGNEPIKVVEVFPDRAALHAGLRSGRVDVAVDDYLSTLYSTHKDGASDLRTVGDKFEDENLGLLMPRPGGKRHPLYEVIYRGMLRYYRGDVKIPVRAYKKWFGDGSSVNLDRADQVLQDTLTSVNVLLGVIVALMYVAWAAITFKQHRSLARYKKRRTQLLKRLGCPIMFSRFQALAGAKKLFSQIATSSSGGETVDMTHVMTVMKEIGYGEGNQCREMMFKIMQSSENQSLAASARRDSLKAEFDMEEFSCFMADLAMHDSAPDKVAMVRMNEPARPVDAVRLTRELREHVELVEEKCNMLDYELRGGRLDPSIQAPPTKAHDASGEYEIKRVASDEANYLRSVSHH